jgi:hypothetical protein
MNRKLTRREFLKLSGMTLSNLALNPIFPDNPPDYFSGLIARVATHSISVFDAPDTDAHTVDYRFQDELLNVYYEVESPTGPIYNPVWYRVWGGFVHSAYIQPVRIRYNHVMDTIPKNLQLMEVTVPYSQPYTYSKWTGWQKYQDFKLYYQSTHWVIDIVEGPDNKAWYKIEDELWDGYNYYAPASLLCPIPDEELTPIAPDLPFEDKRVEVSLENQILTAYERDKVVLETQISSGVFTGQTTNGYPTTTPKGQHNIYSKMPSKHMGASGLAGVSGENIPLPGVPWTSFFAEGGYAFHGTYWHNNFGVPMSKGCINMRNEDAKWLFRWLRPVSEPNKVETRGYGTRVIVF